MREIYYFYSAFSDTFLGILLDEALKSSLKEKKEIYFITCYGFLDVCLSNPTGNKGVCSLCKNLTKNTLTKHLGNFGKVLYLNDYSNNSVNYDDLVFVYKNATEYKNIEYNNIPIGYASLSTYISLTRNHQPLINQESKKYFDTLLVQSIRLADAFSNIINDIKPNSVCTYNGRYSEIRPVFEVSRNKNIDVTLFEGIFKGQKIYKTSFNNVMPHNIKEILSMIEKCWNNNDLTEEEKIELGKSFYTKRRKGIVAGDKVYINNQEGGKLPDNWDSKMQNIVIFNSSEDEFKSIGDEWEDLSLFPEQIIGLSTIFEKFKDDNNIHFYLRIHPNLGVINYKYHTDLYKFDEIYTNVTVISPSESVSTYDLMDASDKVIVFGSTMGMESAYWGKPVILLTCSLYYYLDLCYIPKNVDDLFKLITSKLKSKYNVNLLKLGVFFLNKDPLIIDHEKQFSYIDFNIKRYLFFGKKLSTHNFQTMFGSPLIYSLSVAIKRMFALKFYKKTIALPTKDD